METIDPCHRQLTPYLELFRSLYGPDHSLMSFFMWLETQNLSKDVPYLDWLTPEQLLRYQIIVKQGLLYHQIGEIYEKIHYANPDQEYIFNVEMDGRLILIPAEKTIHHVSISYGKPVLGCGNMLVNQGKITRIELESGHYLPTVEDGLQLINVLLELGITLDPSTPFSFYHNLQKHVLSVGEFVQSFSSSEVVDVNTPNR